MWPLIALAIVLAGITWRWRVRSQLDAQWKRDAHVLGFRRDPRVSPTVMRRDRGGRHHTVRMSWSPVNGRACMEVAARLEPTLPVHLFASTDSDRDLLVPLLPRMKFRGFAAVAADDQPWATSLLELAGARLFKVAALTTVEVTESAALIRLLESHPEWFESGRPEAVSLSRELRLDTVRLSHATKDVTLYLTHRAFAGHFVEVGVAPEGTITFVGLIG